MKYTGIFQLAGVALITSLLAACASKPVTTTGTSVPSVITAPEEIDDVSGPREKIDMAHKVWQEQRDALLRDTYLIEAADGFLSLGERDKALQVIYTLREQGVVDQLKDELNFLTAAAYLDSDISPTELLPLVTAGQLDGKWQRRQLAIQRQLYIASNQYLAAANSQLMLEDPDQDTIIDIWRWVNKATDAERDAASGKYPLMQPFLALYELIETHGLDTPALTRSLAQFRQVYRGHAIAEHIENLILLPDTLVQPDPDELVVMLPLSGRYENTGNAVKQGILAAYYQQLQRQPASQLPQLRFIDTQDKDPTLLIEELGSAEWVLGPLLKDTLDGVLPLLPPRITMLALNRPEQQSRSPQPDATPGLSEEEESEAIATDSSRLQAPLAPNSLDASTDTFTEQGPVAESLYFALAPEDEAHQLADLIYAKGYRAPIVVSAQSSLYQRMNDAFSERWKGLNEGRVEDKRVNLTQVSFSDSASLRDGITRALDVAQSNDRISQIKYMINEEVYNMPRNRQDIDAVVVFASPQHTELLNPMVEASLLPANNARVPVYATSRSMDYDSGKNQWRDLQNVHFLDMPWMMPNHQWQALSDEVSRLWPNELTQSRRLFAFGVDAYNLVPKLANLKAYPQAHAEGLTGKLKLNDNGEIHRILPRAIINDEKIKPVTE